MAQEHDDNRTFTMSFQILADDLARVNRMGAEAFDERLGALQACIDPNHEHDLGGLAGYFFSSQERAWDEADPGQRMRMVQDYLKQVQALTPIEIPTD